MDEYIERKVKEILRQYDDAPWPEDQWINIENAFVLNLHVDEEVDDLNEHHDVYKADLYIVGEDGKAVLQMYIAVPTDWESYHEGNK